MSPQCPACQSALNDTDEKLVCTKCRWSGHICALCQCAEGESKHHLTPASQGGRKTQRLCNECHAQIHVTLTNKQIAKSYSTVEALLGHPQILKFVEWRAKHPKVVVNARWTKERHRHGRYA